VSSNLRRELKRLAERSSHKRAAVAYVTSDEEVRFSEGDTLIVDASNRMIACGDTDAAVLRRAFDRGASLFSLEGLHAKLMLFDRTAVVGSANLSASALTEAALITTDHVIFAGIASLLHEMALAADVVDEPFLRRIEKIKVKRSPRRGVSSRRRRTFAERGSRTWLIRVGELKPEAYPQEQKRADRGQEIAEGQRQHPRSSVSWVRWAGTSKFRSEAQQGDSVIQIYKRLGAKRPRICRHSPILRVQPEPTCTRFYIEDSARQNETSLSRTQFERLARICGLGRIGKSPYRLIPAEVADLMFKRWNNVRSGRAN
jgi:hypothetical protein